MRNMRSALGLLSLVVLGCGPGAAAQTIRPADPTASTALGEAPCREVTAGAEPLVVDWKPEQRGDLEVAMKDGLAVVSYSCKGIKVLADCHVDGSYTFAGMTKKEQVIKLTNSDEVAANLPLSGVTIGGGMQRGSSIDVAMILIGKRRTTWKEPTKADLQGQCEGATHFVRSANIGAFAMQTGTSAKARAAAELFGAGAKGESSSEKSTANTDGDPKACDSSTPDAKSPPTQCGAAVRLVLAPIKAGAAAPPDKPVEAAVEAEAMCPQGLVLAEGKCTRKEDAATHLCEPNAADDCKVQCDKGHAGSCANLGRLHLRGAGVEKSEAKASEVFQKACDGGDVEGCGALGTLVAGSDAAKAVGLWTKACDGAVAGSCTSLGKAALEGTGTDKNPDKALALFVRGCDGGDPQGCASAADRTRMGKTPEEQQRALQLDNRACQGGIPASCVTVGKAYDGGSMLVGRNAILAQMSFRRACFRGDANGCFELGRSLWDTQPEESKRHFQMACMRQDMRACAAMALLYGEKRAVIAPMALKQQLSQSCMAGNALDCTESGLVELAANNKTVVVSLQRACTQGQKMACKLAELAK